MQLFGIGSLRDCATERSSAVVHDIVDRLWRQDPTPRLARIFAHVVQSLLAHILDDGQLQ